MYNELGKLWTARSESEFDALEQNGLYETSIFASYSSETLFKMFNNYNYYRQI